MAQKLNYTPAQQAAIHARGSNVLVAASAGSGKTRVLVERVQYLLQQNVGIDRMLVVTFTKAAASEMRERIQLSLQQTIKQTTDRQRKRWLTQQLLHLNTAAISTIDAFCLRIVQQYYYVIQLDPVFRQLTDETERQLLAEDVWNTVREAKYQEQRPLFELLTQNFSNDRSDDGLTAVVMKVFEFANARPDPEKWLQQLSDNYQWPETESFVQSQFYQGQLKPLLQDQLTELQAQVSRLQQQAEVQELTALAQALTNDQQQIKDLQNLILKASWDQLRTAFNGFKLTRPKNSKVLPEQKDSKQQLMEQRKQLKLQFEKLIERFFTADEQQLRQINQQTQQLVGELAQTVLDFMQAFTAEKRRRHVLDFSDLEHLALQILSSPTNTGQQVRETLQQQFQEIMVDEYQDTNQLQEAILQQLTQPDPGNLFMVGDVKQSIYGFRQADPTMFLAKYHAFSQAQNTGQRILLAENFRSTANVDNFINLLFSQLMDQKIGGIAYDQTAQLKFGAKYYPELPQDQVEINLFLANDQAAQSSSRAPENSGSEPYQADFSVDSKAQGEVRMVGQRIKELLHSQQIFDRQTKKLRRLEPQDIALLVPTRNNNLLIMDEFQQLGIPVIIKDAQNYFQTVEIQIMLSFLQIIDNPAQDIPLVSVLRSPIVGLKENELAYLRITDKTGDYYAAVRKFQQQGPSEAAPEFEQQLYRKIDHFWQLLQHLRTLARRSELADLIWEIYDQTGFLDYVGGMPGGAQRQANLHALYERASAYEKMSFKGLFQFIRFIQRMQEQQHDLAAAPAQTTPNAVQVMTIHGSKGLEFPVVFLLNATHQINQQDLRQSYLLDSAGGIGLTWVDPAQRLKTATLAKVLLQDRAQKKLAAEQMRLLYVALTRAQQKLIITGSYKNQADAVKQWAAAQQSQRLLLPDSLRQKTASFMDWIGASLFRHPAFTDQHDEIQATVLPELQTFNARFQLNWQTAADLPLVTAKQALTTDQQSEPQEEQQLAVIKKELSYQYPNQILTATTAYQSVSEIKRLFNDPDEEELDFMASTQRPTPPARARRLVSADLALPQFMNQDQAIKPTQLGTAVHLVLQKVPLKKQPTRESLAELVTQLTNNGMISAKIATQIDLTAILNFFASSLGQKILAQPEQVKREVPFSLLLPAGQLFPDLAKVSEDILVHGIIDGFLVTPKDVYLFDYKTDYIQAGNAVKEKQLIERYQGQLNLYAQALVKILKRPVTHKYLYLLRIGKLVELK